MMEEKVSLRMNPRDLILNCPYSGQWSWGILHPGFASQITSVNSWRSGGWVQLSSWVLGWVESSVFPKFLVASGEIAATDFRHLTKDPSARSKPASYTKQLKCSTFWWPISGIATPVLSGNQKQRLTTEVCGHLPWAVPLLCRGVICLLLLRGFFLIKISHIIKIHLTF